MLANLAHNAQIIAGMRPDGVAPAAGAAEIGQEFGPTVRKPGLSGIECTPHFSMGMVARVKLGAGAFAQRRRSARCQTSGTRRQADGPTSRPGELTAT